jgi:hypothetical protein
LPIGTTIAAWILFARRKSVAAVIVTSVPLLLAVPLVAYLGLLLLFNIFGGG